MVHWGKIVTYMKSHTVSLPSLSNWTSMLGADDAIFIDRSNGHPLSVSHKVDKFLLFLRVAEAEQPAGETRAGESPARFETAEAEVTPD